MRAESQELWAESISFPGCHLSGIASHLSDRTPRDDRLILLNVELDSLWLVGDVDLESHPLTPVLSLLLIPPDSCALGYCASFSLYQYCCVVVG
jgi:hypothetical protein